MKRLTLLAGHFVLLAMASCGGQYAFARRSGVDVQWLKGREATVCHETAAERGIPR